MHIMDESIEDSQKAINKGAGGVLVVGQVLAVCKHEDLGENGLIPTICTKVRLDGVCNSSAGWQRISECLWPIFLDKIMSLMFSEKL